MTFGHGYRIKCKVAPAVIVKVSGGETTGCIAQKKVLFYRPFRFSDTIYGEIPLC